MSSWLSTATQKAKETIGVSSRTVDADVEAGLVKLTALEKDVGLLRKTLETLCSSLTVHTPGARAQMTEVMVRLGEGYVEEGVQFRSFRDAHETLDGPVVSKLSSTFQAAVLQPLDEWVASFSDVRSGTVELEKVRVTYDHYKEKLAGIKRDKDATLLKGKVFDKASEEKLQRNVEKLKESEAAYFNMRDLTLAQMMVVFEDAGHRLDFILLRTMQFEKQALEDSLKAIKPWDAIVPPLLAQVKDRKLGSQTANRITPLISMVRECREANKRLPLDKPMPGTAPSVSFGAGAAAGGGGGGGGSRSDNKAAAAEDSSPAPVSMASFLTPQPAAAEAFAAAADASGGKGNPISAAPSTFAAAAKGGALPAAAAALSGAGNPFGAVPTVATKPATQASAPPAISPGNPFGEAAPMPSAAAGPNAAEAFDPFSGGGGGGGEFDPFGTGAHTTGAGATTGSAQKSSDPFAM